MNQSNTTGNVAIAIGIVNVLQPYHDNTQGEELKPLLDRSKPLVKKIINSYPRGRVRVRMSRLGGWK